MKRVKKIASAAVLTVFFTISGNQAYAYFCKCDRVPDPGQVVGRCLEESGPTGCHALCGNLAVGDICFYGASTE